ncbi:hypothetical protein GH714_005685 [Hevea brasiliensis]|uniref:Protein kinase domain-containing protein n=1 Tax=Hevea brasiliensis TaxID=3981 RepID=A0A6A6MAM5_HEVBR|nr:hypothetical protein GH714_005685 [Hevea brasiliensis]
MCSGVSFALQVMQLTLASLLYAFDISTPSSKQVELDERFGVTSHEATQLEVILSPRLPAYWFLLIFPATTTSRSNVSGENEPRVIQRDDYTAADKVVVAVKAEKVISKTALAWALTHVVHPGDCITLLAVFSNCKTGKRFWTFPRFSGDCGSSQRDRLPDRICQISESCSQMVLQFHNQVEVGVRIKVVSSTSGSAVAAEAKRNGANWVVLDKGVLGDGQVIAVKLLKSGNSQADADADFCREVRILSCAQHRNVVLLIGKQESTSRLALTDENSNWTARGLRYLHEECRVGCIHRDMRPNNILVTHDFEPLAADFGLARWHSEWNISTEERVIGTSGYLAPEYIDGGKITQKVEFMHLEWYC